MPIVTYCNDEWLRYDAFKLFNFVWTQMKWHVYEFPSSVPEDANEFDADQSESEASKLHKFICVSLASFFVLFCILYMLHYFTKNWNYVDK